MAGILWAFALLGATTAPTAIDAPCTQPLELPDELAERSARFIIVGEIHGTDTFPEAFGDLVCAQSLDKPVLVQFEVPGEWGELIDDYVSSGERAKLEAFLQTPMFTMGSYDGRSSAAFVDLIHRLRAMVEAGHRIRVAGFQPSWRTIGPQYYYEMAMAHALTRNAGERSNALNLVLVGNYHARRHEDSVERKSAAAFLLPKDTTILGVCPQGGTASTLTADGEVQMELDDTAIEAPRGIIARSTFQQPEMRDQTMFDGYICAGRPSMASPRAVSAKAGSE